MAEQPQTPSPSETPSPEPEHAGTQRPGPPPAASAAPVVDDEIQTVRVRRSPKIPVFLVLGAALGVFVAMILTFAFDGSENPAANGAVYSSGQVFGFLALVCGAAGLALGGLVAIILDRTVGRRTREVQVDHETVHPAE